VTERPAAGRAAPGDAARPAPLRRNRDFVLLISGQLLSRAGSELTSVAYPLLALALTGSAAKAGLVGFARLVPDAVFGLPAGLAADRWDRRRIMLTADAVRALTVGGLAVVLAAGSTVFWVVPALAFVEGTGETVFTACQAGALRAVVPARQLPAAVGVQQARSAIVSLVGPPLGGALFTVARALPFAADAVSYTFSLTSLVAMRAHFQEPRTADRPPLRAQLAEGFRFLWGQPFLRTTTFLYGIGNFALPGIFLVIVVVGHRDGLSGGQIGALFAVFAAFLLLGSLLSPLARRRLSMRAIILVELWAWLGSLAFLAAPSVYVLTAAILPQAIAMPITDSVVVSYRIAITPDRLLGRVESVRSTLARAALPLGPLVAGALLTVASPRETVAIFAACAVVLAAWGTLSPAIRAAPALSELG
jgi:MFS family permease